MILVDERTFRAPLQREYPMSSQAEPLGEHDFDMRLYKSNDGNSGLIEWEIPDLDEVYHIGLWLEGGELIDYDSVFSLPAEAITLLEANGIKVPEDFR